jgi:hypothetical protein
VGGTTHTGFNVGGIYDFDEGHHLLFSAGDDIHGSNRGMGYLAFQWTFGPHEAEKRDAAPDQKPNEKKEAAPAK